MTGRIKSMSISLELRNGTFVKDFIHVVDQPERVWSSFRDCLCNTYIVHAEIVFINQEDEEFHLRKNRDGTSSLCMKVEKR